MRSNYKKIGEYIHLVDERNKDLNVNTLLGLTVNKEFIPSVANIIGSNMANYKIIKKGQFACSLMQVRRDKKMPVALLRDFDEAIISQAYPVFEIIDTEKISPEYLMMWMSRPEFDREACFYAVGGVRGSLEWEDFCNMQLPVPGFKKQQEIVKEYHTIVDRMKLNEKLNQRLEETAQAIYKKWFVDFEFPIPSEYAEKMGQPEMKGQPYKSSGGEMVYDEGLDREVPACWDLSKIDNIVRFNYANYNKKTDNLKTLKYLDTSSITCNRINGTQNLTVGLDTIPSRAKRKVEHNDIVYSTVRPNLRHYGLLKNPESNMIVSTGFMVIQSTKTEIPNELILMWLTTDEMVEYLHSKAEMSVSTYPSIKPEDVLDIKITLPGKKQLYLLERLLKPLFELLCNNHKEILSLNKLSTILHQKLASV